MIGLSLLFSCQSLLGIRPVREKTPKQLKAFLLKQELDTTPLFALWHKALDSLQSIPYKPGWPAGFRPLQFRVFNSQGQLIGQYSSCEGHFRKVTPLKNYPPGPLSMPAEPAADFGKNLRMIRNEQDQIPALSARDNDLSFIVFWGTWMGQPGKHLIRKVERYKKQHRDHKIQILYVNVGESPE